MKNYFSAALLVTSAILLTCCSTLSPVDAKRPPPGPHYWQRTNATSAKFMYGPKAQQLLEENLVTCVTEVHELKRLNAILPARDPNDIESARPPQEQTFHGKSAYHLSPAQEQRYQEELAETGKVRADYLPFYDFKSCMNYKGWELVEHTPYNLAEEDAIAYVNSIRDREYHTRILSNDFPGTY